MSGAESGSNPMGMPPGDAVANSAAAGKFSSHDGTTRTARILIRKDKTNPRRLAYLTLFLFAVQPPWPMFVLGLVLVIAAIALHAWAAGYLARAGYVERETVLTVGGPYRHNRNPYYLAHMTMDFGFFCMAGLAWFYPIYFAVIFTVYRRWVMEEEPFLAREFGEEYEKFRRAVPRWGFRLKPAHNLGKDMFFSWDTFRINRERSRMVPHIIIMFVFIAYLIAGNPLAGVDTMVKLTWIAGVAVWLVLHDIRPIDVSRVSMVWLVVAAAMAAGTLGVVGFAPVWGEWHTLSAAAALVVAMVLGASVVMKTLPGYAAKSGKSPEQLYARPQLQWFIITLAFGLLTFRLGGIWLAIAIPLLLWALELGGVVRPRLLPQSRAVAIVLSALLVLMAIVALLNFPA